MTTVIRGAWVRSALGLGGVRVLPLGPEAAVAAGLLARDGFPGDPADRMIYATARIAGVRLATKDRALRRVRRRRHALVAAAP